MGMMLLMLLIFPTLYFLFFFNFIYLFMAVLGLCYCMDLPLVAVSGGHSPVAEHGLFTAEFSFIVERRI